MRSHRSVPSSSCARRGRGVGEEVGWKGAIIRARAGNGNYFREQVVQYMALRYIKETGGRPNPGGRKARGTTWLADIGACPGSRQWPRPAGGRRDRRIRIPAATRDAGRWLPSGDSPRPVGRRRLCRERARPRTFPGQRAFRFRPSVARRPARDARHADGSIPDQRLNARANELARCSRGRRRPGSPAESCSRGAGRRPRVEPLRATGRSSCRARSAGGCASARACPRVEPPRRACSRAVDLHRKPTRFRG